MFTGCSNYRGYGFNQPITLYNNVTNCAQMFNNCSYFNQPVNIPDSVINCHAMFSTCLLLNKPVTIGNSVTDCSSMFFQCRYFNQSIIIPDSVTNCSSIFYWCDKMSGDITFGNNVINMSYAVFANNRSTINIYINNTSSDVNVSGLLHSNYPHGYDNTAYIFCNNIEILNKSTTGSIIGNNDPITWEEVTNGYYNSQYNVYIYNNYSAETGRL